MSWLLLSLALVTFTLPSGEAQGSNRKPYFRPEPYVAQISEGAEVDDYVTTVMAVDPDGDNITYNIPEGTTGSDKFKINNTGDILVKAQLDREAASTYMITIEARDDVFRQDYPTRTLFIVIEDINDETPNFILGDTQLNIVENSMGQLLETYFAEDGDEGLAGEVQYSITTSDVPFSIDENNGELRVSGDVDYDNGPRNYPITLAATDLGDSPKTGYLLVNIAVEDADDQPPQFSPSSYTAEISENATNGTLVETVTASDRDMGIDNTILYDIVEVTGADVVPFEIDEFSGVISTNTTLNHEVSSSYTITVKATENSTAQRSASTTVVVSVLDINDNPPVFDVKTYNESVRESTSLNLTILTVRATDKDGMEHDDFVYQIITPDAQSIFAVDSSGRISLKTSLDYEMEQSHSFQVRAIETVGTGTLNGTTTVNIDVVNENDEPPIFTNKDNYNAQIDENSAIGTTVYFVSSTDRDIVPYDSRTYSIVANSTGSDVFDINSNTGEIFVRNGSSPEDLNYDIGATSYALFVEVTDGVQKDSAVVNVDLIPLNDNSPRIDDPTPTFNVVEGVTGQAGSLSASDGDSNAEHNTLLWCITDGNDEGFFELRNFNGSNTVILQVVKPFNYEDETSYSLTLRVTDGNICQGIFANSSTIIHVAVAHVTVNVLDSNDNPPAFTNASYYFTIEEEGGEGDMVGTVSVTDMDSSFIISYGLEGVVNNMFTIDNETGVIRTSANIDRESLGTDNPYLSMFRVVATDRHNTSEVIQTVTTDVTVAISDINDNDPIFDETGFDNLEIRENDQIFTFSFSATDADADINAELTYRIAVGNEESLFSLTTMNGVGVLGNTGLNRERNSSHDIVVEATDGGNRTSNATIHVVVLDINDNSPMIVPAVLSAEIPEDALPGTLVVDINATDLDEGTNAELHFFFEDSSGSFVRVLDPFQINELSGEVTVSNLLNREVQEQYDLTVFVRDSGSPSDMNTREVLTICVTDINDNGPTFTGDRTIQAAIPENFTVGEELFQVSARDADNIMTNSSCPSEGINSVIRYSLVFVSGNDHGNLFEIDPVSGSVTLRQNLNYESTITYYFNVQAADRNGSADAMTSLNPVILTVTPINDNKPNMSNDSYRIEIAENTQIGTTYRLVSATDSDQGAMDGVVRFSGNYSNLVEIDEVSGDIRVTGPLDYEVSPQMFQFTAFAHDRGVPSLSDSATVTVVVVDINDERPMFQNTPYEVDFDEGDYSASELDTGLGVYANDSDGSTNNVVTYSLVNTVGGRFRIDNTSGQLFAGGIFDAESMQQEYTLTVIATDSGTPSMSSEATITVRINDVNDEDPILERSMYETNIPENSTMERVLFTVSASDPDVNKTTNGRIRFDLMGSTAFAVNETTGEVVFTGMEVFDREQPLTSVMFEILVSDFGIGSTSRTSTASVTVYIDDVNDNTPMFVDSDYSQSIEEDTSPGTTIETISANDADQALNANVTYELRNNYGLFDVDRFTGAVVLTNPLDYETQNRSYFLVFVARDRGAPSLSSTATATITVTNTIDSIPTFIGDPYTATIPENADFNQFVLTLSVEDLDEGDSITFTLNGSDAVLFSQENSVSSGSLYTTDIIVGNSAIFDYETDPISYSFTVGATDSNSLTATTTVRVFISDYNDETPEFTQPQYRSEITAGVPVPTFVTTVNARDDDRSPTNSNITYSFSSNTTSTVETLFSLDAENGDIRTQADIIYTSGLSYTFYVVANDSAIPPLSSAVEVLVIINDNNINAPLFRQNVYNGSIDEEESSGQFVLEVMATDPENGTVVYEIVAEPNFRFDTNRLLTNARLNFESQSQYTFTIRARDTGAVPRYGYAQVIVDVIDKNDNDPQFVGEPFVFSIRENPDVGSIVGTVSATDADSGSNARLVFSSGISSHFNVTSSGVIVVNNPAELDREMQMNFFLEVTVRDSGEPVNMQSTTVTVTLRDAKDTPPEFTMDTYAGSIAEGSGQENLVATVSASDKDEDDPITYQIESGDDAEKKFQIDNFGRILTTSEMLNRESTPQYTLIVTVTDSVGMMDTATVVVTVTDVNDNDPEFSVGPTVTYNIEETSGTPDRLIWTFTATDEDDGDNAIIDYSVTDDSSGVFYFNSNQLFARCCVDREDPRFMQGDFAVYLLEITATDRATGGQARSSSIQVTFNVSDVNDNAPMFTLSGYSVSISESSEVGEHVVLVTATDPDVGDNAEVIYELLGSGLFSIDAQTGNVTVAGSLPDGVSFYSLNLVARDLGTPSESQMVLLNITLLDERDNAPRFSQSIYGPSILENSPTNTIVENVIATDPDGGASIEYMLVDSFSKFAIHQNGSLYILDRLNREDEDSYTIYVVASDGGPNPQFSTATVQVTVLDENDNDPMFVGAPYSASVAENSRGGVFVAEVNADDEDDGNNGLVRYSLSGNGSNHFTISQSTGIITVSNAANLDREADSTYVLSVTATDTGADPRSDITSITITITDENDNAPKFSPAIYPLSIPEDFYVNETRITELSVLAMDDDGDTGLTYAIVSGSDGVFDIANQTGDILVVGPLDREEREVYSLIVTATDSGPSVFFRGTATVRVRITDINDNEPEFQQEVYRVQITEGTAAESQFVVKVVAMDDDSNSNAVVRYSLVNGTDYFDIDEQFGNVYTKAISFDREAQSSYVIVAEARDQGDSPRSSTVSIFVSVRDINDGEPYFRPATHHVDVVVPQSAPIHISRLVAYDNDEGQNSEIEYRISSNPHSLVLNDSIPGLIVALSHLDETLAGETYSLTVTALDRGSPRLTGTATVIINFINSTDPRPLFAKSLYEVSLKENDINARLMGFATISFPGTLEVNFTEYSPSNLVISPTLTSQTWFVNLDQSGESFDRESRGFYSLTMVATSTSSGTSSSGYATLYLSIEDENDNIPMFLTEPYSATVVEMTVRESPIGVVVMATDLDSGFYGDVTYSFLQNKNESFRVDAMSGEITVNNNLDREVDPTFELIVAASDGGRRSSTTTVNVEILDVNDNDPVFVGVFNRTIAENFPLGQVVVQVEAMDKDADINSRLTYSFEGVGSVPFSIDSTSGAIRTTQTLDYDGGATFYDLTVVAKDGGSSPRSATTTFRITLTDVNDCVPTFSNPIYTFSIIEEVAKDSQVGRVPATDCDSGDNQRITYTIVNGNEEGKFKMVDDSILLNKTIDYEEFKAFQLTVEAKDNGVDVQLSSQAEVTIVIVDDNDNTPQFSNITLPIEVVEGLATSTVIGFVSASDPDEGINGTVNYRIEQHSSTGDFAINPINGDILVNGDINRENIPYYWLYISAFDLGREPRTAFLNVTIDILDINDNAPSFNDPLLDCSNVRRSVEVQENSRVGTSVYVASATDADIDANQNLRYSIIGGDPGDVFSISTEGNITVLNSPDRESIINGRFTLTIQVADSGKPSLNTLGCLEVVILDCNDFPPQFVNPPSEISFPECEVSQSLLTLAATDADEAGTVNAEISFRFCPDQPSYREFGLLPSNSSDAVKLAVLEALDRENRTSYQLCVEAYNARSVAGCTNSGTGQSSRIMLTVNVGDKNDNAPQFTNAMCNATLSEIEQVSNRTVVTISAFDVDEPGTSNSALKWIAPIEDNPFHINAGNGIITLRRALDYESAPQYQLDYEVADAGPTTPAQPGVFCKDQAATSTITCTFTILDENDNAPTFDGTPYRVEVCEEDSSVGDFFTVSYTDGDRDPYKASSFSIVSWTPDGDVPDLFTINPATGEVSLNRALDREANPVYTINLEVGNREPGVCPDGQTKSCDLISNGTLTIALKDVNDNPPVFSSDQLTAEVPSAVNPPYNIKAIRASDDDIGVNAQISYALQEPPLVPTGTFSINSQTGEVILDGSVQEFEGMSFYLTVIATDRSDGGCGIRPPNMVAVNISVTVVGDLQKICLVFMCNRTVVVNYQSTIERKIEELSNFTVTGPTFVANNIGTENCFSAQNPFTNLLVSFDDLEDQLFNSFTELVNIVPSCPLVSIKSPGREADPVVIPLITPLIPLFALCGAVSLGAIIVLILASNQRRATRRQRKKEYLGNIFFGTAPTDLESRGLIQMEQLQQGTDEITHENPVFIEPFQRWQHVDDSREPSTHVGESAVTVTRGNPAYESQEIRMEMFQDGDDELAVDDDELLAEALKDDSDDEEDILVTAI